MPRYLARRVITKWLPEHEREGHPHRGAIEWLWRCSLCNLVYEKQSDAQVCCGEEKFRLKIAWQKPYYEPSERPVGLWYYGKIKTPLCYGCNKLLEGEEKEFAEEQAAHPGMLGLYCPDCYKKACDEDPSIPWTDPISGETDYEEMAEALGFETERDWYDDEMDSMYDPW